MCLSEVGRVVEVVDGGQAIVDAGGRRRRVSLVALVLEGVNPAPGDWLLLHTGFAIERLEEPQAVELATLARRVRQGGEDR